MFDEVNGSGGGRGADHGRALWSGDYYNEGVVNDHDFFFDKLREECGVFGVFGHPEAAHLAYYGLHALQHRGQESAGICVSDGREFHYHRDMGLVKEIFNTEIMSGLQGAMGIAHVRYSTSGESKIVNAQPLVFKYREGDLAIATNGNLVNAVELRKRLERQGSIFQTSSDTEVVAHLIARSQHDDIVDAVREALQQVDGAYAFLFMTRDKLIAANDPHGLRPFVLGKLGDAYVFASETCAFDAIGAQHVRDIEPGELLVLELGKPELRSERFAAEKRRAVCAMEYIYFARPDSDIDSVNIHSARKRMGRQLAIEAFIDADVVTGVPDSSISAAMRRPSSRGAPPGCWRAASPQHRMPATPSCTISPGTPCRPRWRSVARSRCWQAWIPPWPVCCSSFRRRWPWWWGASPRAGSRCTCPMPRKRPPWMANWWMWCRTSAWCAPSPASGASGAGSSATWR